MDNRKNNKQEENYLDLKPLAAALLRKAWLIVAISVICAAGMFVYTALFVAPEYVNDAIAIQKYVLGMIDSFSE